MRSKTGFLSMIALSAVLLGACSRKESPHYPLISSELVLADSDAAAKLLLTHDTYINQLTTEQVRRASRGAWSELQSYPDWVASRARNWDSSEVEKVRHCLHTLDSLCRPFLRGLPPIVAILKVTGDDQFGAAYTRGNYIVLPQHYFEMRDWYFIYLLAHELFHVWSRENEQQSIALYQAIGFHRDLTISLNPQLEEHYCSNPDYPLLKDYLVRKTDSTESYAVPLFYDRPHSRTYPAKLFHALRNGDHLLLTNDPISDTTIALQYFNSNLSVHSGDIDQPDEILAEEFAMMVFGGASTTLHTLIDSTMRATHRTE